MNITYIIGNGFDLRFGLPTSYADFAQYYAPELCKKADKTKLSELCRKIRLLPRPRSEEDLMQLFLSTSCDSNWSDLEIHLGKFTKRLNEAEFIPFYRHLNRGLDNYLQKVEAVSPPITDEEKERFASCVHNPFQFYTRKERCLIQRHLASQGSYGSLSFITFNYTSTLEQLSSTFPSYYQPSSWSGIFLHQTHHIHGRLNDGGILFGVDNASQVVNVQFQQNPMILDLIIKPRSNEAIGELIDDDCRDCIEQTNIFCIFGTSLGETDQTWWHYIGARLQQDKSVVILLFEYAPGLLETIRHEQTGIKNEVKERLLQTLGLDRNDDELKERIFVSLNSEMFPKRDRMPIPVK